jgi:hypothetical protein
VTPGNLLFLVGVGIELYALKLGVDSRAIAWAGLIYSLMLLKTGYRG